MYKLSRFDYVTVPAGKVTFEIPKECLDYSEINIYYNYAESKRLVDGKDYKRTERRVILGMALEINKE